MHCKNCGVQCTPNSLHTYGVRITRCVTHTTMVCTAHVCKAVPSVPLVPTVPLVLSVPLVPSVPLVL